MPSRRLQQIGRAEPSALARSQPLVHLQGAGFLDEVDHCVLVRSQRDLRPSVEQRAGWANAVGEVALGGRGETGSHPGAAQQGDVAAGQMVGVDRS